MKPLRFVMVGCGAIATSEHLPALRRCKDARLLAVVDPDLRWATKVASRNGAQLAVANCRDLHGSVDAAIVATPNATHVPVATELLERGVHVLCEKPVATTPDAARSLFEISKRSGARLMAAHVRRFQPNLTMVRHLLRRGVVGQPTSLSASQSSQAGQWASRTSYRNHRDLAGGGVLIELGVHLIDLAIWLFDRGVDTVNGSLEWEADQDLESDAELTMRFEGGAVAEIAASDRRSLERVVTVKGTEGWVTTGLDEDQPVTFFNRSARACRFDGAQIARVDPASPFRSQLDEFCRCLLEQKAFPVPEEDVVLGLDVIERIYASQASSRAGASRCGPW